MDALPQTLLFASLSARERLADAARTTAQLGARPDHHASMAVAARAAIFADALLGAMHARLEELKNAAK